MLASRTLTLSPSAYFAFSKLPCSEQAHFRERDLRRFPNQGESGQCPSLQLPVLGDDAALRASAQNYVAATLTRRGKPKSFSGPVCIGARDNG